MNYQVFFENEAKLDLLKAIKWYESSKPGLGQIFLSSVKSKVKILNQQPELFQIRYNEIRTIKIGKFPYLIHYKINKEQRIVIILAVLHAAIDTSRLRVK